MSCHAADLVTIICVESDRCVISSIRPHCVPLWWHSYSAGSTTVTVSMRAARKLSCKDFHWRNHIGANGATAPLEIAEVEFSKCLNPLSFHFFVNGGGGGVS